MKRLFIQDVGVIVDSIYHNSNKSSFEQKSITQISADCAVAQSTVRKIRGILIDKKLLIVEGERRSQKTYWHPDKCSPNPAMLKEIYRTYTSDFKGRVKVERVKKSKNISFEEALQVLSKLGWTEVKKERREGDRIIIEIVKLNQAGEEE